MGLRLILFGAPRVERNGQAIEMDTRKALALFAYLALSRSEQQRDLLVTLLYPEADPAGARAAFRRTLSTLNGALGDGVLAIRRDTVGIAANAGLWVDVLEFEACLRQTDEPASLNQAANLYRGDFMAGFSLRDSPAFDDWQYHQGENLRRLLDGALDRLASSLAKRGDYASAVQAAERRVRLDPLLEEAQCQLMVLYARSGQRGVALRQYRECVRVLEQELGVAPLETTTLLYQEILSGKLENAAPSTDNEKLTQIHAQPVQPIPQTSPLVGRENEMAVLGQVLQPGSTSGWFIGVAGEAGVGKTRLAEEFLTHARRTGRVIAQANCYEGQSGLAYAPFLEAIQPLLESEGAVMRLAALPQAVLSEAARLFPQLANGQFLPPLPEGPGAQTRFFEALRLLVNSLLSGNTSNGGTIPGILFLDDVHWADSGTLDLIAYLARRIKPAGWVLLVTWRDEHGPVSERFHQLLAELTRSGVALHLPLKRMRLEDIGALVSSINPSLTPGLVERLYQESEGLPFIAVEYLHSGSPPSEDWNMPGGVRALLHHRLQEPGEAARQLLSAAAVIGRSFDFNTLHGISGRSEWETVTGLEELVRLGLVREQESGDYDFSHEKIRTLVYEETSLARRRLLHLRIGEMLAASGSSSHDPGSRAGVVANHFLQAGQSQRAADYFRQAGEHARRLHANQQALYAFQSALASGHPDPAGLHEACGDLLTLSGEYAAAISSYQAAAAFCAPTHLSNLMHKLGKVYQRRGEWEIAQAHFQTALESAGAGEDPVWHAHLFADWSLTAYRAGQPGQALELAEKALQFARQDSSALAQALNMLGILARSRGELDQAWDFFDRSLEAANDPENLELRCAALHNLARLEQERGHAEKGIPLALQALDYCVLLGDQHHQAALLNTLADLQHMLGREPESMDYLRQAVTLFAEIGEDVSSNQAEIWKLTEW